MNYELSTIMKNNTSQKILEYVKEKKQVTARELVNFLDISERAVFKQLKNLYNKGKVDKIGKPPKVFYFLKEKSEKSQVFNISQKVKKIIEDNYLIITPIGEKRRGVQGFIYWCQKNNLPIEKTAAEYEKTYQKYGRYKKGNFIDGTYKLKKTFEKVFVDKLYYLEFYSIERFGKTKLGWMLLYAKQSQDKTLIKELIETFRSKIKGLIKKHSIKAVGFIPPTVKREVQLMKELRKILNLSLPTIDIQKAKTPVIVPQKSLSNLVDRIENAKKTFFVNDNRVFDNILLIDDAVGSGATMNETAKKIRERKLAKGKIYGLAITGSFKGFQVISEV